MLTLLVQQTFWVDRKLISDNSLFKRILITFSNCKETYNDLMGSVYHFSELTGIQISDSTL